MKEAYGLIVVIDPSDPKHGVGYPVSLMRSCETDTYVAHTIIDDTPFESTRCVFPETACEELLRLIEQTDDVNDIVLVRVPL